MTGPAARPAETFRARALLPWVAASAATAVLLSLVGRPVGQVLGEALNAGALVLAVPALVRQSRRLQGRTGVAVGLLAASGAAVLVARVLAALSAPAVGVPVPRALLELSFALGGLLLGAGLATLFRRSDVLRTVRSAAEAALLTVAAALLATATVVSGLDDPRLRLPQEFVLNVAWPVVLAPLAALALGGLVSPRRQQHRALLAVLGALLCYGLFNGGVAALLLRGQTEVQGTGLAALPVLATGLVVATGHLLADETAVARPVRPAVALVPLATAIGLLCLTVLWWTGRPPTSVEMVLTALGGLLALVRQAAADREAVALQDDFHRQARTDALTGLANRTALLERADAGCSDGALLLVDLDGFKQVNDSSGHVAGDRVLAEVADRLRGVVGDAGLVARLGGDEFAVLLDDDTDAGPTSARVVAALEERFCVDGSPVALSASVGLALVRDAPDAASLLDRADVAMYASKAAGHGGTTWWGVDLGTRVRAEQRLRRDLRVQLLGDGEQLSVVHQPVFEIATGRVRGAEALVRWEHPELGQVSPGVFVPLVESEGLSRHLSDRVLELACADAARWRGAGHDVPVGVNLCGDELVDDLPERLLETMGRHGIPGSALVLELTERTLVDAGERTVDLLRRIHDLGPHIALDDFGAGYSALAYLSRLPLQVLKLDRSLVAGLHEDEGAEAVVEAVIGLSRRLGLRVVAEGVEVDGELEALRRLGCSSAQGFGLGRPAPVEVLLARLEHEATTPSVPPPRRASRPSARADRARPGAVSP